MVNAHRRRAGVMALLLALMLWQWGQAGWILAKAELAQYLISRAWGQTVDAAQSSKQSSRQRPWPWADTWPVARLQAPAQGVDLYVLAGGDGTTLAFGPGQMAGTAAPGAGSSVLGGHRDTHFAFLESLTVGDRLRVQDQSGQWHSYRVSNTRVVDSRTQPLWVDDRQQQLLLITCYPFHTLQVGGPLRYVVTAETLLGSEPASADAQLLSALLPSQLPSQLPQQLPSLLPTHQVGHGRTIHF